MRSHCREFSLVDLVMKIVTMAEDVGSIGQRVHVLEDAVADVFEKDWAAPEAKAKEEQRDHWAELRQFGVAVLPSTQLQLC